MSTRWRIGKIIAEQWEVQQVVAGGMGVVYIVRDRATHEKLAVKSYREDLLNSQVIARFANEAKTWISIPPHPNIVRAKFYKIVEQTPLLFLEFAGDGSLRERLQSLRNVVSRDDHLASRFDRMATEYKRLSEVVGDFAIQFCNGMIHAQKHGVLAHRDIKPANCLFHKGVLKISDFGLAKSLDAVDHISLHSARRRQPLRVMVVGPFRVDREQLIRFLGSKSYDAVVVEKSEQVLQHLADQSFDLFVVEDRWDLFSTVGQIRTSDSESGVRTPIIACCNAGTKSSQRLRHEECLQAGIDQCVFSPITSAELFRAIDLCRCTRESCDSLNASSGELRTPEPMSNDTPSMTIDWETLDVIATASGQVAGTPTHMAPEQYHGLRYADIRSDIYSFGVMLYQMCNGSLPFSANNVSKYRECHLFLPPPGLGTAFDRLNDVVTRCLSKNPDDRFCDFSEIRSALEDSIFDPEAAEGAVELRSLTPIDHRNSQLDDVELFEIAQSQIALCDYDRALATLVQVSKNKPNSGEVWREMGLLLMNHLGRLVEAQECLERAKRLGENVDGEIAKCRDMQKMTGDSY